MKHRGVALIYAQQARDCGIEHYSSFVGVSTHVGELLVEAAKDNDVDILVLGTKEIGMVCSCLCAQHFLFQPGIKSTFQNIQSICPPSCEPPPEYAMCSFCGA